MAKANEVNGYKIHSSDLTNLVLLNLIKDTSKKIFLSTGGSTIEEIAYATNTLKNSKKRLVLMHGFQNYPTQIDNCDLLKIKMYKNIFGKHCDIGYQDHLSGEDPLNFTTPLIAIGMGAQFLEKHVTMDRSKKGVDYYSSLEPKEFKSFVNLVRDSERSIGENPESINKKEENYRNNVKKVWYLKKNIRKGDKIKENNLIMKRPADNYVNCTNIEDLINKKSLENIDTNDPIRRSSLKNFVTALIVVRTASKRLPNKWIKLFYVLPKKSRTIF